MMSARARPIESLSNPAKRGRVAALLATASLIALVSDMPMAAAEDCTATAAPPSDIATPSMLYDALRAGTNAQLLAVGFLRKPVEQACAWIYEVKVMTASGSVVELDFAAAGLDLIGARGPNNDRDAAALVKNLGGDSTLLATDAKQNGGGFSASGSGKGSGSGSGGDDGGEGGEGGNSGSGSGGSGSGGSGSGGSGSGGSGSGGSGEGGEGGGNSGSGGGSGEGGEGGGNSGSGGGSGEGGEGGGDD
jgi:uncharacterized membrane protein YgcG